MSLEKEKNIYMLSGKKRLHFVFVERVATSFVNLTKRNVLCVNVCI